MAGFSPDEANVLLLAALLQPERSAERLLRVATETGRNKEAVLYLLERDDSQWKIGVW